MNKKHITLLIVCSAALFVCAVAVSASSLAGYTPLYAVRMEQQSSEMSFLPTQMTGFAYDAENGFTVDYQASQYCGAELLSTAPGETFCSTCFPECDTFEWTCSGSYTCCITCFFQSCWGTCYTCPGQGHTCDETSCQETCSTCDDPTCPNTCWETCDDPTCFDTCEHTCRYTCEKPCVP